MDESEIIEEEDELITDNQFSGSGNDSNDPTTHTNKQFRLIRQRQRQNLSTIYDAMHGDDDDNDDDDGSGANTVTYIETSEVGADDPLNLGDNVSWIGLSS